MLDAAGEARGIGLDPAGAAVLGKLSETVTLGLLVLALPRLLGPADYGRFSLALSLVVIASFVLNCGSGSLLTRFVPTAAPADRPALARAVAVHLARRRVAILILLGLACVVAGLVHPASTLIIALAFAALVADVLTTLIFQVGLALGQTLLFTMRYATQNICFLVAAVVLARIAGPAGALAALLFGTLVALAVGAGILRTVLGASPGAALPPGAARFDRLSSLGGIFVFALQRCVVPALAVYGAAAVEQGYAALALGIGLAGASVVWQVSTVRLPALAANPVAAEAEALLREDAVRLLWVGGGLALLAAATVPWAAPTLLGRAFTPAMTALGPALAIIPASVVVVFGVQLGALRLRADLRVWAAAGGIPTFIVSALVLIPPAGAAGAVGALLAATVVTGLVSTVQFRDRWSLRLCLAAAALSAAVTAIGVGAGSLA